MFSTIRFTYAEQTSSIAVMSIKHLWAPWRLEFIKGPPATECVFCALPKQSNDQEALILHRGNECYVVLNKYPYNNGHLMVIPFFHTADYALVTPSALSEMNHLTKLCLKVLKERYQPQGFNIGMNLGEAGGAGIKEHLHLHIVPRWNGDTNFMPVVAETRCLPQHLVTCFNELQSLFAQVGSI
jgi:ATP adenylyltransferase